MLKKRYRQALGRWGETQAADFLIARGYKIVERNYRTPYGEIDLIAEKSETLVFVEVKTRTTNTYGLPEASITASKRKHLIASAQAYLQSLPTLNLQWRIDVIAVRKLRGSTSPEIIHFENAIC